MFSQNQVAILNRCGGDNRANGSDDYTELANDDDRNAEVHDYVEHNTVAISHSLLCGYFK